MVRMPSLDLLIQTSSVSSRNALGSRTAWLLPVVKTLAVAIMVHLSKNIYANVYILS